MFFLLRIAFWLSIVLVLLPSGSPAPQTTTSFDAVEALSAAGATVSDMSQFCGRQPEACEVGSQAAVAFGHRAQAGARMVYDYLFNDRNARGEEKNARSETGSIKGAVKMTVPASQHTLRPSDMQPAWRGPAPRKDAQGKPGDARNS